MSPNGQPPYQPRNVFVAEDPAARQAVRELKDEVTGLREQVRVLTAELAGLRKRLEPKEAEREPLDWTIGE